MKESSKQTIKSITSKSFGGLTKEYYFRNFLFGLAIFVLYFFTMKNKQISFYAFFIPTLFLYPYSRFVYESVANFIVGENSFFVNMRFFFIMKLITVFLCFIFAIVIAPIGLLYLYFYHTKQEKKAVIEEE